MIIFNIRDLDFVLPELTCIKPPHLQTKRASDLRKSDIEQHKFVRKIVSLIVVSVAVVITLYVWGIIETTSATDDATARRHVVGIARV